MADETSTAHAESNAPTDERLSLLYSGRLADDGALLLDEYAASLEGWRSVFLLLGETYFHQFSELRQVRGTRLLRIEVVQERRGSWETVLVFVVGAIAGGIIGNRADAAVVWSFGKLLEWYQDAISTFVRKKSATTDIIAVADALRSLVAERGYAVNEGLIAAPDEALLPGTSDFTDEDDDSVAGTVDRIQVLAEKLDHLLKAATTPLERSCERMSVRRGDGSSLLQIGPAEREVIASPLTLPPPKRNWVQARVKFERINRKTGRALIHFDSDSPHHGAHYSKIVDPAVREPGNAYTEAFNDDRSIDVWVRQTHPEPGRLNFQWEITSDDPDDLPLFRMR